MTTAQGVSLLLLPYEEDGMNDDRTGSVTYCYYEEDGMNDDRTGSVTTAITKRMG